MADDTELPVYDIPRLHARRNVDRFTEPSYVDGITRQLLADLHEQAAAAGMRLAGSNIEVSLESDPGNRVTVTATAHAERIPPPPPVDVREPVTRDEPTDYERLALAGLHEPNQYLLMLLAFRCGWHARGFEERAAGA